MPHWNTISEVTQIEALELEAMVIRHKRLSAFLSAAPKLNDYSPLTEDECREYIRLFCEFIVAEIEAVELDKSKRLVHVWKEFHDLQKQLVSRYPRSSRDSPDEKLLIETSFKMPEHIKQLFLDALPKSAQRVIMPNNEE